MSMTLEQIEAEALKLTPEERELLAESLFASLDSAQEAIDQEGLPRLGGAIMNCVRGQCAGSRWPKSLPI